MVENRWIVHLKDGRTVVNGGSIQVEHINPEDVTSVELIAPNGKKITVCGSPFVKNFRTLVTACDLIDYNSGTVKHAEEERLLMFDVGDVTVVITIDCYSGNSKVTFRGR